MRLKELLFNDKYVASIIFIFIILFSGLNGLLSRFISMVFLSVMV